MTNKALAQSVQDAKKRSLLESLVAPHIVEMPELRENNLFWKLAEQCKDTISYAASMGQELVFMTSHSSFGRPSNKVMLMVGDIPSVIEITDCVYDAGKFHVIEQGRKLTAVQSAADLLEYLKRHIG